MGYTPLRGHNRLKHPRVGVKLSWQTWWNTRGMEFPFARSSLIFFVLSFCHLLLLTHDQGRCPQPKAGGLLSGAVLRTEGDRREPKRTSPPTTAGGPLTPARAAGGRDHKVQQHDLPPQDGGFLKTETHGDLVIFLTFP